MTEADRLEKLRALGKQFADWAHRRRCHRASSRGFTMKSKKKWAETSQALLIEHIELLRRANDLTFGKRTFGRSLHRRWDLMSKEQKQRRLDALGPIRLLG